MAAQQFQIFAPTRTADGLLMVLSDFIKPGGVSFEEARTLSNDAHHATSLLQDLSLVRSDTTAAVSAPSVKVISEDLAAALSSAEFSDIQLISSDGVSFPAHRVILAVRCSSLRTLLLGGEKKITVSIRSDELRQVLSYVYTGKCVVLSCKDALTLHAAATQMDLPGLALICDRVFSALLTEQNVVQNWRRAEAAGVRPLASRCSQFTCLFISGVPKADILSLTALQMREIVSSHVLNLSEDMLFLTLLRWGHAQPAAMAATTRMAKADAVRELLTDLLPCVQMHSLSPECLFDVVERSGVVPREHLLAIYRERLSSVGGFSLPTRQASSDVWLNNFMPTFSDIGLVIDICDDTATLQLSAPIAAGDVLQINGKRFVCECSESLLNEPVKVAVPVGTSIMASYRVSKLVWSSSNGSNSNGGGGGGGANANGLTGSQSTPVGEGQLTSLLGSSGFSPFGGGGGGGSLSMPRGGAGLPVMLGQPNSL